MPAVSFADAAAALAMKSPSTLYRLKADGRLEGYLRPGGRGGSMLLELEPEGRPSLLEHVCGVIQSQHGALKPSPTLLLAERLRREEQQTHRQEQPAAPVDVELEGIKSFWGGDESGPGWGRWAPEEELSDAEYWDHIARICAGLMGLEPDNLLEINGANLRELAGFLVDARRDVDAGARWDSERWWGRDTATLLPEAAAGCELSAAELRRSLELGRVPEQLREEVESVLARAGQAP